jgi:pimeloyl-ACP methyl ester carboxylesterase
MGPAALMLREPGEPREDTMQAAARTFVLVHGAFHGGWCWRRVADLLAKAGHKVFTPTLTGLGERAHLINAEVNLSTHINDVVNVLEWEGLRNVVLCGHSYGGFVISGVAEQMQDAIAAMAFVDAFVPESGDAFATLVSPAMRERITAAVTKGEGTIAPVPAAVFQVNENDRAWVDGLCVPQPIATFTETITLTGARERVAKKVYIRAKGYEALAFDAALAKVRSRPSWSAFELPCGHDIMVDMPEALAAILLESV